MPSVENIPWTMCKVSFDISDADKIWTELADPGMKHKLPEGWNLIETDETGTRSIAIFNIDGILRIEDGNEVRKIINLIENPNKVQEPRHLYDVVNAMMEAIPTEQEELCQ